MAKSGHISIGRLGEDIVAGYLTHRGFTLLDRNYRKKWGELDIVAQKSGVLHFVEVKAGSWHRATWPREGEEVYRPEDHLDTRKRARMARALRTYLAEKHIGAEQEWTADLAVVLINERTRHARVRWLWNVLL